MKFLRLFFIFLLCAVLTYAAEIPMRQSLQEPQTDGIRCVLLSDSGERSLFSTESCTVTADSDEATELIICADRGFYAELSRYLGEVGSIEEAAEKLHGITNDVHLSAIAEAVYPNIVTTLTEDEFKILLTALRLYSHQ